MDTVSYPGQVREFSELVGSIYDAAVHPARWPNALELISATLGFANATLSINDLPTGQFRLNVSVGIAPQWLERMPDYSDDIAEMWGGLGLLMQQPLDRAMVLSRMNPVAIEQPTNRYVIEWGLPQGLIDLIGVTLVRDGSTIGGLGMGRHKDRGTIGDAEVATAELLIPHLQRAVAIGRLLETGTDRQNGFEDVVEQLGTPVFIVGGNCQIRHANGAARTLLREGKVLRARANILSSPSATATRTLAEAVALSAENEAALSMRAFGVPLRGDDGKMNVLHVLPLRRRIRLAPQTAAAAAIFVSTPSTRPGTVGEIVSALYGLTPAERRVFDQIAAGRTPREIARGLAVADSTVKTHLLRVFGKTGLKRQADLVSLASALASPIRARLD